MRATGVGIDLPFGEMAKAETAHKSSGRQKAARIPSFHVTSEGIGFKLVCGGVGIPARFGLSPMRIWTERTGEKVRFHILH